MLAYQMLVFLFLVVLMGKSWTLSWLIAPISLLLITLNALWIGLLVSVFATRFRDLGELLNNLFRLIFFVTPIMWMPEMKEELAVVAELNPFYHIIEIFRAPLLTGTLTVHSWVVSTVICCIGWLIAFILFSKYRSRISFWV